MIYHYTSIETLALILHNKKIRFNRLDKVDDVLEGSLLKESHYVFASCWTESEHENIALWNMYAKNMRGVRIGFKSSPFMKHQIFPGKYRNITINSPILDMPLQLSEHFGKNYFISPMIEYNDFFKPVVYMNNEDLKSSYAGMISKNNNSGVTIYPRELGCVKHEIWKFQEECRFILTIYPPYIDAINLVKQIKAEIPPLIDYFDLDIANNAFDLMDVQLGPQCSIADEIIVNSLLKNYGVKSNCTESSLKGKIRENK